MRLSSGSTLDYGNYYRSVLIIAFIGSAPLAWAACWSLIDFAWLSLWREDPSDGLLLLGGLGVIAVFLSFVGAATFRGTWCLLSMVLAALAGLSRLVYPWQRAGPDPVWTAWFAAVAYAAATAVTFFARRAFAPRAP